MMAKKQATVDDTREHEAAIAATEPPQVIALAESGIITYSDGMITWRDGHLAHIANQYKGDPAKCERDYSDDLVVARKYSATEWSALLEAQ